MSIKICILGLPRCGSHYVVELIKRSYLNQSVELTDLKEPFGRDDPVKIDLVNGLLTSRYDADAQCGQRQFESVDELVATRLSLLQTSGDQNLIVRLFPFDYLSPYFKTIIEQLKSIDFKFIVLLRENVEEQLLSYARSRVTNVWIGERSDQPIEFNIRAFVSMRWLSDKISEFNQLIDSLDINYEQCIYERSVDDLSRILNITIDSEVSIQKQRIDDPYSAIINSAQVKHFLSDIGRRP
jgi:hypothetical protein